MSPAITNALGWFFCLLVLVDIIVMYLSPAWYEDYNFAYAVVYSITTFFLAVGCYIADRKIGAAAYVLFSVMTAYRWWHNDRNKRKRRKQLERASGFVKDIGGRLKVVRPNET